MNAGGGRAPQGEGGRHEIVGGFDGLKVWKLDGLGWEGGRRASDCYCAGAPWLCRLRALSFALRTIDSKPALSSAFLLEFV